MFKITKVYSDENGDSRFDTVDIPLKEAGEIGSLSKLFPAKGAIFREVKPGYDYGLHNAPQRQLVVLLDGEIEIETSLGEKRSFHAGDILLMEDTDGKGHKTRNLKTQRRKSIFIPLE